MRNLLLVVGVVGGALMACGNGPQGFTGSLGGPGTGTVVSGSSSGSGGSSSGSATSGDDGGAAAEASAPGGDSGTAPGTDSGVHGFDSGSPGSDAAGVLGTCTSGKYYKSSGDGSSTMAPGEACVSCHAKSNQASHLSIGGSVYPTLNEPVDCLGVNTSGVTVVITDANGQKVTLAVNSAGNFYTSQALATPYKASVFHNGAELDMLTPQTSGDCNACHTPMGLNGAPGRIMMP